MLSFSSSGVLT